MIHLQSKKDGIQKQNNHCHLPKKRKQEKLPNMLKHQNLDNI